MSFIDQALKANELYAQNYKSNLGSHPEPKIVVVTCMDPRLSDLQGILGLKNGDMNVIRNGGPSITNDVLAQLIVSTRVFGAQEIMLLNHSGCEFTTFSDEELNEKFTRLSGNAGPVPMKFNSFKDPEDHTRDQIRVIRAHAWIPKEVPVRGFVFDVLSGRLREIKPEIYLRDTTHH